MNEFIICGKNILIGYEKKPISYNLLNFNLIKNKLTVLLGSNGVGKSTLIKTISQLLPKISGDIKIYNKNIEEFSQEELSKTISVVLTDKISAGGLTVEELVSLGRQPYTGFLGKLSLNDKLLVTNAINSVKLSHKSNSFVANLSDGEKQKALIAKALVQETEIIILDEPTAFLDISAKVEILNLLRDLAQNHNKTILLSTHDIEYALKIADYLWIINNDGLFCGQTEDMILSGKIDLIFNNNLLKYNILTNTIENKFQFKKTAFLECNDDIVKILITNLLKRNGYKILAKKNDYDILIIVMSNNCFIIKNRLGEVREIEGFEEFEKVVSSNI
ncbi:MAG: ABC transporter ATP-binding protein [Bacteroidales bacterium]|nr:ABC transporter ATP-binding protein [Bacteroidales bacterium]